MSKRQPTTFHQIHLMRKHQCRDDREVEEYSDVKQLPHKVDSCKHVAWHQRHFGMRKTRSAVGGKLRSMFWLQWKPAGKATLSQDGHVSQTRDLNEFEEEKTYKIEPHIIIIIIIFSHTCCLLITCKKSKQQQQQQ
ncbi:hypothetical protein T05_1517 [Trichinella murrelli]|uniref:Uncharacterized protein n=1 Tax=Trichinella murrelli TaxID=144512 RepID=A0A0V0UBN3_9BILA|nr:hypothetical protein T05_1517 [Trichinella murrelli]